MIDTKNRFLVVSNEKASRLTNERGECRLHKEVLDPLGKRAEHLVTPTPEDIQRAVKPGDVVAVAGGDGTINWVLNELARHEESNDITLLPLAFGGANDISHSLYGHKKFEDIVSHGRKYDAYPIEARIISGDVEQVIYGLGYVSLGATARAALKMNNNRTNGLSRQQRYYRALTGALGAEQFGYINADGEYQVGFDISTQNGRMAQVLHPNTKRFFKHSIELTKTNSLAKFLGVGTLWLQGAHKPEVIHGEGKFYAKPLVDVYMQADGEQNRILRGQELTIANDGLIKIVRLR